MKAALVQMRVVTDKRKNLQIASDYIKQAAQQGADMVILPEMFCCPYQTANFPVYAEMEGGSHWQMMSNAAKENHVYLVAGSMPERDAKGLIYNTSYVFDRDGKQIAKHRKMHLFDIDVKGGQCFKESDTLTAGNQVTVFDTEFCKFGLAICYDFRFPELSRLMVERGAKGIIVPAAFNMTTGPAHWDILFRTRALDNQVFTIGTAPARDDHSCYVSYANSIVVSPWADVILKMDENEGMKLCDLDLERVESVRNQLPLLAHRRRDVYTLRENRCNP